MDVEGSVAVGMEMVVAVSEAMEAMAEEVEDEAIATEHCAWHDTTH